ncbi:hypothetical protein GCM10010448_63040 [Streptomyces glomeratus]|uniref:Uncharacterized protein n=1 Tax=Streptomyces glomeratus TaxID=284452 RepID=A0ABP6M442_9ACTN
MALGGSTLPQGWTGGRLGRAVTVWAWPMRPGAQPGAGAAALTAFLAGVPCTPCAGHTRKGPAPEARGLLGEREGPDRQAEMPSIRAKASSAPYGCR